MTLARCREILRSSAPVVLTEAPAGCGKTHEAAALAADLAPTLDPGREVLVLAHTNAAVQAFWARTRGVRGSVRVTTIDAFCLDLLSPYASVLGLPSDLRRQVGPGRDRVPFDTLAGKAVELLSRSPSLARMVAARHPVIIADEHQDARRDQHRVARILAEAGPARLRIFGDPLQAIYDDGDAISWRQLECEADVCIALDTPQRWSQAPELGEWILRARDALKAGTALPMSGRPAAVRVTYVPGMPDAGFGRGNPRFLAQPLQAFLNRHRQGTVSVLAASRLLSVGLYGCGRGRLAFNEGADFEGAYSTLERAIAAVGHPRDLCLIILDLLGEVATGLTAAYRETLGRALTVQGIQAGRNRVLAPFLATFSPVYSRPDLASFCAVIEGIARCPPVWLRLRQPECLRILGRIRPSGPDDALEALDAAIGARKLSPPQPARSISTIHKAKGLEYDHVLVGNFSAGHFADERGRRLAYVALSRARASVEILVPALAPSPLLPR
ncbi:UvrD-helicase domain-containing protein [Microvirga calopogonii]|uniref:UvrD-helicase domain-containing protein n=1 Tax=Microvirga calopogonii TaxID=2078013 RepID=UPI000E0CF7C5|nr:UvrD-helicase domain-containing protein [Microvirga calopogonii]